LLKTSRLESKRTNWQSLRFQIHHKKRYIAHLERKIETLKTAPILLSISSNPEVYFVGSKDETLGNQVCQFDRQNLQIRVPACLESKYGKYVQCQIDPFPYGQEQIEQAIQENQLGNGLAITYRFYAKEFRWFMAVSFTLKAQPLISRSRNWGCIGVDLNAKSVDWSYVDKDGNLKAHGLFPLHLSGKRRGQAKAIIADVVNQLVILAQTYCCPIVCESLDFNRNKESFRERGRKYARMLSNFVYSRFLETLSNRCGNTGIGLIQVNPAYSSLIGKAKYCRMYGLSSGAAAALVIARRAMRLSERLPGCVTALLGVNPHKHVWSQWNQLNNQLRGVKRHCYYSISNWESMLKFDDELDLSNRLSDKLRAV
jgi:IS605 OrfB family transposase